MSGHNRDMAPKGPSPFRDVLAGLIERSGDGDRVLLRCSCGEHDLTASALAAEMREGTSQGREYALVSLYAARDVLAARGLPEGIVSGLSRDELLACLVPVASVLSERTERPLFPGGPASLAAQQAMEAGGGLEYAEAVMATVRRLLSSDGRPRD